MNYTCFFNSIATKYDRVYLLMPQQTIITGVLGDAIWQAWSHSFKLENQHLRRLLMDRKLHRERGAIEVRAVGLALKENGFGLSSNSGLDTVSSLS